jgi:hypothetical protein
MHDAPESCGGGGGLPESLPLAASPPLDASAFAASFPEVDPSEPPPASGSPSIGAEAKSPPHAARSNGRNEAMAAKRRVVVAWQ